MTISHCGVYPEPSQRHAAQRCCGGDAICGSSGRIAHMVAAQGPTMDSIGVVGS